MDVRKIPIAQINPAPYNPRKDLQPDDPAYQRIEKMLDSFGYVVPIVWNKRTGNLVGGHQRLKVFQSEGRKEVEVSVVDLTLEQEKILNAGLNNIHGENDPLKLAALIEEAREQAPEDLEGAGFDDELLGELLGKINVETIDTPPERVPTMPETPPAQTQPGDLWEFPEGSRLVCGHPTEPQAIAKVLAGARADVCFASPPMDDVEDGSQWRETMDQWFNAVRHHCASVVCNVQMLADNKRGMMHWLNHRLDDFVDLIVWEKQRGNPQMQPNVLSNVFEFLIVFGGNGTRTIPMGDFHGTVGNLVKVKSEHPADKGTPGVPYELASWVIKDLCGASKTILDPFGACGATLMACAATGRQSFTMEASPEACDRICQRFYDATQRAPQRNGEPFTPWDKE